MVENQAWKIHQDRVTKKMYQEDKCDCRLSWNCQEGINQNGNRCRKKILALINVQIKATERPYAKFLQQM